MRILGIHGWKERSHDAAACLIENGQLTCMAEEERFTRRKYAYDSIPINASAYCLHEAGITLDQIDVIAWGWDYPTHYNLRDLPWPYSTSDLMHILFPKEYFQWTRMPKLEMIPHHLAHAASAFYTSPFAEAAILVVDGQGETASTTLACGKGNHIAPVREFPISQSLGYFYEAVSKHIGFRSHDAGKTMGLAAYGDSVPKIEFLELSDEGYRFSLPEVQCQSSSHQLDEQALVMDLWEPILRRIAAKPNHVDYVYTPTQGRFRPVHTVRTQDRQLAALAQTVIEEVVRHLVAILLKRCNTSNLCIAGGVGLNCVSNGKLISEGIVDNVYIQPAAGDAGASLGAALVVAAREGELQPSYMRQVYWGPQFSDKEIQRILQGYGVKYDTPDHVTEVTSELLMKGKVVGWFQGRMEVGPRALGNRSILADPRDRSIADRVNRIKGRERWRPLAPSLLDHRRYDYLTADCPSPHMLLSFGVQQDKRLAVPGVVHVDGSTRPQTVTYEDNPTYFRLIQAFESLTGTGLILNTSFNTAGEPIVCTPIHALHTFYASDLDALVIGSYLV